MTNALDLCRALIRCDSVTPKDGGALAVLDAKLKDIGFITHQVMFSEPGTPDIMNLYARLGGGAPHLVFAGHTDVVPPGNEADWRHGPFAADLAEDMLWGRGASDMKGAIAAFAAAAARFVAKHGPPKGSIGFLITGDEEGPAVNGTEKLLRWATERGEHFDHCLVGEPTNPERLGDMVKIGRRGSLNGRLSVHGKQGHAAYPHRADNPVPALARLIGALIDPPLDSGTPHFDASNLEVVAVEAGSKAWNVIPAEAEARFNIRFNDLWTPDSLAAELQRRCEAAAQRAAQGPARFSLSFEPCNAQAFITEPDAFTDLVAASVARHTGHRPVLSTSGGTSDARFIRAYCPVVEFGLVGATMHGIDERVAVADLETLTDIYVAIMEAYFQ